VNPSVIHVVWPTVLSGSEVRYIRRHLQSVPRSATVLSNATGDAAAVELGNNGGASDGPGGTRDPAGVFYCVGVVGPWI